MAKERGTNLSIYLGPVAMRMLDAIVRKHQRAREGDRTVAAASRSEVIQGGLHLAFGDAFPEYNDRLKEEMATLAKEYAAGERTIEELAQVATQVGMTVQLKFLDELEAAGQ